MTYDLAIATVAMQLQAKEKAIYYNIFIHPRPLTKQTVNADAASQRRVISYLTNSVSARQADSHFVRLEVLSEVLNKLDMTTKEDVSKDLKPN